MVTIGLIKPKSPTNVGAIMRAAGCFAADAVCYTGERYDRAVRFNTDTKHRTRSIPLVGVACLLDVVPENAKIVCVELVEDAIPLHEYQHPENTFYIFGPEDGTITQNIIDRADDVIYIPTKGCLNLAATVNIVLYDRMIKSDQLIANNELISQSKDVNNRIKIKNSGILQS